MKFLYNAKKTTSAAHIWTGNDTACRMWSTGGFLMGNKKLHDDAGKRRICMMCQSQFKKYELAKATPVSFG